ncbi:SAVED domain-containing protein [Pedobacter frigoris]|uniref:SAVED domain-containing protein n=1 Tax=Pedobacter frigoris TaxID=2571272 RepID=UPI00292F3750|nr:SAVED domain-containing protein [Pedobacter frigoris]
MNTREKIPESVKFRLWGKAAGRCQFTGCNEPMYYDRLTKAEFNTAYLAHIYAVSPGGNRYDPELSPKLVKDISNLMLMCDKHHRDIDDKANEGYYTAPFLLQMKAAHEQRIELITEIGSEHQSHVLLFGAKIGTHEVPLSYRVAAEAMLPHKYPAGTSAIELGLKNAVFEDHTSEYWTFQEKQLVEMFNRHVLPLKGSHDVQHFSIFALAPIPLLIRLGTLLSDIYSADVYQKHREPNTWKWQTITTDHPINFSKPSDTSGVPALKISLSGTITDDRIAKVMGGGASIYHITIPVPDNDFLKSKAHLANFRTTLRHALDHIKSIHGHDQVLHVFPAVPVSAAVELGRVWMPKADMAMCIYDQNNKLNNFIPTLTIKHHD